jgi:hypothetical protein
MEKLTLIAYKQDGQWIVNDNGNLVNIPMYVITKNELYSYLDRQLDVSYIVIFE